MTTKVLYHGPHCTDGFGACLAAWLKFGKEAEYIPIDYSDLVPDFEADDDVYIVDFSFPKEATERIQSQCNQLTILDHHKTYIESLGFDFKTFTDAVFALEGRVPGKAILNKRKSGAVLAWEFFHPTQPVPEFFLRLQDRDLFTKRIADNGAWFSALQDYRDGIPVYPKEFELWKQLMELDQSILVEQGRKPYADRMKRCEAMADEFILVNIAGYVVPACNAPKTWSDVAHILLERFPDCHFAACWRNDLEKHVRKWDLRSMRETDTAGFPTPDTGFDVSQIATQFVYYDENNKEHRGGGHHNAAGFTLPIITTLDDLANPSN